MRVMSMVGLLLLIPGAAVGASLPAPQLFAQRCAMCHQAGGKGLPGQFPRLSGRVASIAQSSAGRHYLTLVLLNGMVGTITADAQSYSGLMPSMAALPDEDIAAILNHVLSLGVAVKAGKPAPFTAAEIAAVRLENGMSAGKVAAERTKLAAAGLLP